MRLRLPFMPGSRAWRICLPCVRVRLACMAQVVSVGSEKALLKKLRRRQRGLEKTRERFAQASRRIAADRSDRQIQREHRLRQRRRGGSGGAGGNREGGRAGRLGKVEGGKHRRGHGGALGAIRKTAAGGTRRARRPGRHKRKR